MKKKGGLKKVIIIVIVIVVIAAIFGGKGKSKDPALSNTATQNESSQSGKIGDDAANNESTPQENTTTNEQENATSNQPEDTKDKNYISPELKEFLESYEAFIDEYCAFMENYNSSDAAQLVKYASLMAKYSDFAKKADAYDESTMTDAEEIYYVETLNRINVKLMKASQNIH